jgi:hypothetical protein
MDIIQIFLMVSLGLLTALLIFLGVHVYYVLVELQSALRILQKTLNNASEITEMVKSPVSSLTKISGWAGMFASMREGMKFYKSIRNKGNNRSKNSDEGNE